MAADLPNAARPYRADSTRAEDALRDEAQLVGTLYRIGGSVATPRLAR
jgi:hypothetical protein